MGGEPYVQIAGASCAHCERRIVSLADGAGCPACGSAVHVEEACWRAHWEGTHAGAASYRGAAGAPPPPGALPGDDPLRPIASFPHLGGGAHLCTACLHRVDAILTTTFLGFPRFRCPDCAAEVLLPLTTARKIVYLLFVVGAVVITVAALIEGVIAFPGVLAILAGYALVKNRSLVERLAVAEVAEPTAPAPGTKKKKKKKKAPGLRDIDRDR